MANKKKHSPKKHSFKHVASETASSTPLAATVDSKRSVGKSVAAADVRDFRYVAGDMRRVLVFGGILILLELVLWGVIEFTAFGQQIYSLVRL